MKLILGVSLLCTLSCGHHVDPQKRQMLVMDVMGLGTVTALGSGAAQGLHVAGIAAAGLEPDADENSDTQTAKVQP